MRWTYDHDVGAGGLLLGGGAYTTASRGGGSKKGCGKGRKHGEGEKLHVELQKSILNKD